MNWLYILQGNSQRLLLGHLRAFMFELVVSAKFEMGQGAGFVSTSDRRWRHQISSALTKTSGISYVHIS